jgi:prepilin-type N-terminal cleavage/methylation domain-containing protein
MKRNSGFTLIEMVVVLAVVAILAAILTPTIAKNIDDAKIARANNEVQVIAAAMGSFYKDVGRWPTKQNATSTADYYYILYSDGNPMSGGISQWRSDGAWAARADEFANHLARNTPGGANAAANQYAVTGELKWKGPYITSIPADPWGTHYSCNVISFWYNAAYMNYAIFVLSAGADRAADTGYNLAKDDTTTPIAQDDDVGYRLQ